AYVHDRVLDTERVAEAASVREAPDQRELAALEIGRHAATAARLLALRAFAGGGSLSGAVATADPTALATRPLGRPQLVQFHTSSTFTRCWTLKIIPRTDGVSGSSTVWRMRRKPRLRTVSRWLAR